MFYKSCPNATFLILVRKLLFPKNVDFWSNTYITDVLYVDTVLSPVMSICTDEMSISDVNSHKTSLANIYMRLKMYCYICAC